MDTQNFFSLDGLTDLSKRNGIDMRPTLLRVLTDLYVHRLTHTPEEERHYTELALRMLEVVDVPTRVAVAKRFARYLSPPLRVLQWLAHDLPMVAAELRAHPLLQPPGNAGTRAAVAPAPADAAGDAAQSAAAFRPMDAATAAELNELFFMSNAEERRLILLNLDVVDPVIDGGRRLAADAAIGVDLETALLRGKRDLFVLRLARALRIPYAQARRIARDELGEPVVVACKALVLTREVLYRILMFINPAVGHSVARVHALAALYEEMTASAADAMLAIWQALNDIEHSAGKHRPLNWDDETRRRVRQALIVTRKPATSPARDRRNAS
jgi:hypothetical protein